MGSHIWAEAELHSLRLHATVADTSTQMQFVCSRNNKKTRKKTAGKWWIGLNERWGRNLEFDTRLKICDQEECLQLLASTPAKSGRVVTKRSSLKTPSSMAHFLQEQAIHVGFFGWPSGSCWNSKVMGMGVSWCYLLGWTCQGAQRGLHAWVSCVVIAVCTIQTTPHAPLQKLPGLAAWPPSVQAKAFNNIYFPLFHRSVLVINSHCSPKRFIVKGNPENVCATLTTNTLLLSRRDSHVI